MEAATNEVEHKFIGSHENLLFMFQNLVGSEHAQVKTTKKLKIYRDTYDWVLSRLNYCFRVQAGSKPAQKKNKLIREWAKIKDAVSWKATCKSDGHRCAVNGRTRFEGKTGWIDVPGKPERDRPPDHHDSEYTRNRPIDHHDFNNPRLTQFFDSAIGPDNLLEDVGYTTEERQIFYLSIDPKNPDAKVEIAFIPVRIPVDDKVYSVCKLEIENFENSCTPETFRKFMASINIPKGVECTHVSMTDIVYSLHVGDDPYKREALNGRYVEVASLPGVTVEETDDKTSPPDDGRADRDRPGNNNQGLALAA